MTSNRSVSEMVERLERLMIAHPRGEYARGWNCALEEAADVVRTASSQAQSDDVVERVEQAIRSADEADYRTAEVRTSDLRALIAVGKSAGGK